MITAFTKQNKFKRKIVLVTNGTGPMSSEDLTDVAEKLVEVNIELVILYVPLGWLFLQCMLTMSSGADFDDPEYGVKEEDKDMNKVCSPYEW